MAPRCKWTRYRAMHRGESIFTFRGERSETAAAAWFFSFRDDIEMCVSLSSHTLSTGTLRPMQNAGAFAANCNAECRWWNWLGHHRTVCCVMEKTAQRWLTQLLSLLLCSEWCWWLLELVKLQQNGVALIFARRRLLPQRKSYFRRAQLIFPHCLLICFVIRSLTRDSRMLEQDARTAPFLNFLLFPAKWNLQHKK